MADGRFAPVAALEIVLPIAVGALVMLWSIVKVRSVFRLLEGHRYRGYWLTMAVLMVFFLFGYVAAALIVVGGYDHLFKLLTGVVFLFGALFVSLVVHTGSMTIDELVRSRDELRERERELEWLYQVTGVLNRILRHNLRNDLNVILGLLDVVGENLDDDHGHVESMQDQTWKLIDLSNKAREVHETVTRDVSRGPSTVSEIVEEAVDEYSVRFPNAEIQVEDALGQGIRAGPMFRTALENLLSNAIRHNDDDPTVTVSIHESGSNVDAVDVTVADDGPGIPPEELAVIRDNRETPLRHGSGLGLWLVDWIVDRYGGELTFEANDPTGSVATIVLPRADPSTDTTTATAQETGQATT